MGGFFSLLLLLCFFVFVFAFLFRVVNAAAGLRSIKVVALIFATKLPALVRST